MVNIERFVVKSVFLDRNVPVDFYIPSFKVNSKRKPHLLLINDGQDLVRMGYENIVGSLLNEQKIADILCVGIHCGADRRLEYGVAGYPDFKNRGNRAGLYQNFVFQELFPMVQKVIGDDFHSIGFCGFSLGGLSAFDLVWDHREIFKIAGIFSGSFWWRSVCQDDPSFDERRHRIMHQKVKSGTFFSGTKFYFETGTLDEYADRNNNGIIDSIDDTISLIEELREKGYEESDILYKEIADGYHDVPTWARAFPSFLQWAYSGQ